MEGAVEAGFSPQAVIGREAELERLEAFFASGQNALGLVGGPGIGKTTLWEAGLAAAREHGLRVLRARPSNAEAQLSFAALTDLFQEVDTTALAGLPSPQLRPLEVALLRAEPGDVVTDSRAVALGLFNALRTLAVHEPVLVAVDDVQWLDSASAEALTFAARRLERDPVRFLLARRPDVVSELERALGRAGGAERVELGPLSLGATRRLLFERLGLTPPRWLLRRVFEATGGNPLFVLEVGRTLLERGRIEIGEDIPVPLVVEDLLGTRVARLSGPLRQLLHALALTSDLRVSQLAAIAREDMLDDAISRGLVVLDGDRVRLSHPLLGAAARGHSPAGERRELHLALADAVVDDAQQARHLALAADAADGELAEVLSSAASKASARGARHEAVELAEHALRLTPSDSPRRSDRVLALAQGLALAGERERLTVFLTRELDSLPPGFARGRGYLLLTDGANRSMDQVRRYLEQALAESRDVPGLRAAVLAEWASNMAVVRVERIADAEAQALEALEQADPEEPGTERVARLGLAWSRAVRGRPIDDLCERSDDTAASIFESVNRVAGVQLAWRGRVNEAREALIGLSTLADERGEERSYAALRVHLCEVELRAGDCEAASRLLDEWSESAGSELFMAPAYERCRSLLAAGRGTLDDAERWATETLARAEETGVRWDLLEGLRARGLAALLAHDATRAVESLGAVWEHMEREGVDDPGVFPVAPDLVGALVETGELERAQSVVDRLTELAEEQRHPWGLVGVKRTAALVRLAGGTYDEKAALALEEAAAEYGQLGLRSDSARSLLALGRARRRFRKWGAAREALDEAAVAFEELGSPGWAEQARAELSRIGARKPRSGGLTPSERRVAELAAAGRSNKEIAQELVITIHTVERHLSRAYAKLGIRSRGQLAAHLAGEKSVQVSGI